jgi:LDH2 family malate/lactate/ureidoglycolate dehydrogenase
MQAWETVAPIPAPALHAFIVDLLAAVGVPAEPADMTASCLVDAELRGLPSHGVLRLPVYVERIRRGLMTADCGWQQIKDGPAFAMIDANYGLGFVAANAAMNVAMKKAATAGVGFVVVRNASHFGAAGYYTRLAAKRGYIAVALSNTAPLLSLPGSDRAAVGNNPISVAVPAADADCPMVTDLALSAASIGRIMLAHAQNASIPSSWALDRRGEPTTDAAEALASWRLQPVGGPKGLSLALAIEALTGVLSGSGFGTQLTSINTDFTRPQSLGQAMLAIDPGVFIAPGELAARMQELRAMVRATGNSDRLPGERSEDVYADNLAAGLRIATKVLDELRTLAQRLSIPEAFARLSAEARPQQEMS